MTTVELLRAAKERIARGWAQGSDHVSAGRDTWCALTATAVAEASPACEAEADRYVARAIDDDVVAWNDYPERTKDDVLAAYDRAIALAEAESAP